MAIVVIVITLCFTSVEIVEAGICDRSTADGCMIDDACVYDAKCCKECPQ